MGKADAAVRNWLSDKRRRHPFWFQTRPVEQERSRIYMK